MDPNSNANTPVVRREVIRTLDDGQIVLRIEVESIAGNWAKLRDELQSATESDLGSGVNAGEQQEVLKAAGLVAPSMPDVDVAAQALSRTISKSDFASMDIVGQFNLGFIVVRRRVAAASITESDSGMAMDDLFIVDQHAADEKYNFETLQQTTSIKSQKLFRPQPLELTASDELLALEKIEVLRQNGFEVEVQTEAGVIGVEDDEILEMPATTPRLALTAQPVSKGTVFDMKDLEELIHRMRDAPAGTIPRCTKARAMFASRACRKSVMIGMPLTKGQMTAVVRHMGTMDQPWNCPHGRPTMRHLADILPERRSRTKREVDWGTFA
ncbi:hypothetical protein C8F01DRAFT_998099 [Mycena amicta]|nr:hypothetical protein C8F01DRAFT_998099 [Mycena amicta]